MGQLDVVLVGVHRVEEIFVLLDEILGCLVTDHPRPVEKLNRFPRVAQRLHHVFERLDRFVVDLRRFLDGLRRLLNRRRVFLILVLYLGEPPLVVEYHRCVVDPGVGRLLQNVHDVPSRPVRLFLKRGYVELVLLD
ncbi:MAG: hypothetical protein ACTSR3_19010, partial [Candidatus Helarchaeota archaeon]